MSKKNNLFTSVPTANVKKNQFDLSHEVKMSGKFGTIYPVLLMDAVPGDEVSDTMTAMVRFAPMLAPIMHRVDVKTHFFFCPYRLLSDHWEDFITGGQDGTLEPVLPYIAPDLVAAQVGGAGAFVKGTMWDYFGLPVFEGTPPLAFEGTHLSAFPFWAHAKIWNDWYRDPNLDQELPIPTELEGDVSEITALGGPGGSFAGGLMFLKNHMWDKDYFTSALPWAQRGAEVLMPLSGNAEVEYSPVSLVTDTAGVPVQATGLLSDILGGLQTAPGPNSARIENIASIVISNSTSSINDFRRSLAIQKWLENNARGGGRYIEQIESHFGMRVPDYRLQRSEYLGGGRQPVNISQVLSTAASDDVPVGDMAGHGISVGKTNRFHYTCREHGLILGFMTIVPRTAYDQGIDRMWLRESKYDHAWPELAHLGEQEIVNKEVFYSFDNADTVANNGVFGYIPRYAEYKFKNDRIAGDFRDNLSFWHLGRIFTSRPALDSQFTTMYENAITEEETYRRIFAVQDGTDYLWCQLFHKLSARRPLPYFGVPTI